MQWSQGMVELLLQPHLELLHCLGPQISLFSQHVCVLGAYFLPSLCRLLFGKDNKRILLCENHSCLIKETSYNSKMSKERDYGWPLGKRKWHSQKEAYREKVENILLPLLLFPFSPCSSFFFSFSFSVLSKPCIPLVSEWRVKGSRLAL